MKPSSFKSTDQYLVKIRAIMLELGAYETRCGVFKHEGFQVEMDLSDIHNDHLLPRLFEIFWTQGRNDTRDQMKEILGLL